MRCGGESKVFEKALRLQKQPNELNSRFHEKHVLQPTLLSQTNIKLFFDGAFCLFIHFLSGSRLTLILYSVSSFDT